MLELSLQQMHVDLHPALSTHPEVVLPALSLLLSALRLLLHLWCLSVPTYKRDTGSTFILLCKGVEIFSLLLEGGKHTYV